MKILLVDDDRSVRQALSMVLDGMKMEVTCAANGEEALQLALTHSFDLIVSDIDMPVMDGLELGRQLRADSRLIDIPLVYMTGSHPKDLEKEVKRLDVATVLWKPIGLESLQNLVRRFEALMER